ncbi:MAG TPA: pyrroline-5-carboxylate reductase [Deltaproteobacteria bacterium]|nr:pyrroline-5-carboxylate reductase [Deltaproteobacteria bacterium]
MKKPKNKIRFGFIGIGKMAQAILAGMLRAGLVRPGEVLVSRTSATALRRIAERYGVATTTDNSEVARRAAWLWLGVKPFQAASVLREIAPRLRQNQALLSMMAGISTATLRRWAGKNLPVVRLMPNTPALLGAGVTGVYFSPQVPPSLKKNLLKLLKPLGETVVVSREGLLDAVTGLSGSGPAFVYYLAQGFIQGGLTAGLTAGQARSLALHTLLGASRMLLESGEAPEQLILQVATKGGTTEAGLKVLQDKKVTSILTKAVVSAARRAAQIREQNECIP